MALPVILWIAVLGRCGAEIASQVALDSATEITIGVSFFTGSIFTALFGLSLNLTLAGMS
jgi:hypothetical protein